MKKLLLLAGVAFVASMFHASSSMAIPSWARKYGVTCSTCHSMVPYLNDYGRTFKLQGYATEPGDFSDELGVSHGLTLEKTSPVSIRFKSKLGVIKGDGDPATDDIHSLDAMHEVELLMGGRLSTDFSGWAEFEYEDEDGFNAPGLGNAMVAYNYSIAFNIAAGFGPLFWTSPYNSHSDMRRLSLGAHSKPFDWKSGNGNVQDERLRKSVQQVSVYGRGGDRVFYTVGFAGAHTFDGGTNREGERPRTGFAAVVVDATDGLSIGAFAVVGKEGDAANMDTAKFNRFGVTLDGDLLDDRLVYQVMGALFQDDDERADSTGATPDAIDNNLLHASVAYALNEVDDHPMLVGEVTYDYWENNTLTTDMSYQDLGLALMAYVRENVRVTAEFHAQLDVPNNGNKAKMFILGGDMAF